MYANWYASDPFDVGNTCRTAFSAGARALGCKGVPRNVTIAMVNAAHANSMASHANGALMRASSIGAWLAPLDDINKVALMARCDTRLSHPSLVCQYANTLYCIAIWYLMRHPGDGQGAMRSVETWAARNGVCEDVCGWLADSSNLVSDANDHGRLAIPNDTTWNPRRTIGFVRWGFTLAFYFLRRGEGYETAVLWTLLEGGDTDTNAAIVGGLMGALHGIDGIPEGMRRAVLEFDPVKMPGQMRPAVFVPGGAPPLV